MRATSDRRMRSRVVPDGNGYSDCRVLAFSTLWERTPRITTREHQSHPHGVGTWWGGGTETGGPGPIAR
jgi:hypothetical protein